MDWKKVNKIIRSSKCILLTTHENPDGDGLGSALAMYYHLIELGKDCRMINCSEVPEVYDFLNQDSIIEFYDAKTHDLWMESCDLAIIFDVGDFKRLRNIKDLIKSNHMTTINIDHHPHPENHPFNINMVDTSAAATGSMIYEFFKQYRSIPLTKPICEGLYIAVMTDTGSFRYSNTDSVCHEIAIASLSAGVNTSKIYQKIYETKPAGSVRLLARVIDNITFENEGELAWFTIDKAMLKAANATAGDVDGFTDFVRSIKGVEVAVMIFENSHNTCRVNFRSKGKYTVNDVAQSMGGGGHQFAAGTFVQGKKEEIMPKVISAVKASLKRQSV